MNAAAAADDDADDDDDTAACCVSDVMCDKPGCRCTGKLVDCSNSVLTELPSVSNITRTRQPRVIILTNSSLSHLPGDVFTSLHWLARLLINNNSLSSIEAHAFTDLSNLLELDLSNNLISHLDASTFEGLVSLRHLNFYNNRLQLLRNSFLSPLISIHHLILASNPLPDVSGDVISFLLTSLVTCSPGWRHSSCLTLIRTSSVVSAHPGWTARPPTIRPPSVLLAHPVWTGARQLLMSSHRVKIWWLTIHFRLLSGSLESLLWLETSLSSSGEQQLTLLLLLLLLQTSRSLREMFCYGEQQQNVTKCRRSSSWTLPCLTVWWESTYWSLRQSTCIIEEHTSSTVRHGDLAPSVSWLEY